MKRVLWLGGAAVVLAVGVAVWFTLTRLDALVAAAIEIYGSEITGAPVRVDSVSIQLSEGRGVIRNLRVGNPEGFSDADAFRLGEIELDIDTASITRQPLVIETLVVHAPEALYELDAHGRSNLDAILANVERYSGSEGGTGDVGSSGGDAAEPAGEETRIRVSRFVFEEGVVSANAAALGHQEPLEAKLPPVRLNDVGGPSGATADELGQQILGALTRSAVRAVAQSQIEKSLTDKLGSEAGAAASKAPKKLFE